MSHRQSQSLRFSPLPLTLHHELENRPDLVHIPGSSNQRASAQRFYALIPPGRNHEASVSITCLPLRLEAETSR